MGDADNTPNMMSVEEVEEMMENAWNELDDGLEGLFSFVNQLNEHNAYIMSEIASCQRLRRWFVALNLFVIPIMLSVWIAFGSTDFVAPDSTVEAFLQAIVLALMLVSGGIGFPFYVLALTKAMFDKAEDEAPSVRLGSEASEIRRASPAVERSESSFPFGVDSLERVTELARQTNRRFLDNVRLDLGSRANREKEADQSGRSGRFDTFESDDNHRVPATEQQLVDLISDPGGFPAHKEETDFCGFKVIIMNKTKDLSVEIEKQEEALPFPNDESLLMDLGDEYRLSNVRSIAVENVGEGDSNRICSKDLMDKDRWQGQTFGL